MKMTNRPADKALQRTGDAYRKVMEEIQQTREYGDAQWAAGKAEWKAEVKKGKAESILMFLAARGIAVDSETRARIEACTDAALLNRWVARAATAASAHDVIAPPPEQA